MAIAKSEQATVKPYRFTVDEYHKMGEAGIFHEDERVELINGEIVHMTPIGRKHSGIVMFLTKQLTKNLGDDVIVNPQNPIVLDERTEPQPDLVLLKPDENYYRDRDVTPNDVFLIVEVSDSSIRYDRDTKLPLYARYNIPEVWIVDIEARAVEVNRGPTSQGYADLQTFTQEQTLSPQPFPNFQLTPREILGKDSTR